ncbi:MAG: diacylglycerol kinase family lipid kinase [Fuerstiella sp.]
MKICLIFNPQAGTADRIKDVLQHLTGGDRCELRPTSRTAMAGQIARQAVDEGFDRIVVAGGDGTISDAVNGIAPDFDAAELAVLPFGTGNDLARALGFLAEQLDVACSRAFDSHLEKVDVIRMTSEENTSYCINVANGGLGGRVAVDVRAEDKQRWGPVAYWMTSVSRLASLPHFHLHLQMDEQTINMDVLGVAVANGRFIGGGFPIAPLALLNDGLMDITICPVLPTFELMAAGINFMLGGEHPDERIQQYQARHVHIQSETDMPFSIDGETSCRVDATFDVIPAALKMVVGRDAPGLQPHSAENINVSES